MIAFRSAALVSALTLAGCATLTPEQQAAHDRFGRNFANAFAGIGAAYAPPSPQVVYAPGSLLPPQPVTCWSTRTVHGIHTTCH